MSTLQYAQLSALLFAACVPLGVCIGYRLGKTSRPPTERDVLLREWQELQAEYRLLVHLGYRSNAEVVLERIKAVDQRIIATGEALPGEPPETREAA